MKTILCYGDSNTWGYMPMTGGRYPEDVRWPKRLAAMLGDDYRVIEEGLNGRTTDFTSQTEPWKNGLMYYTPCLATHRPDVIIFMLGTNDCNNYYHADEKSHELAVRRMLDAQISICTEKQGLVPVTLIMAPAPINRDYAGSPCEQDLDTEHIELSYKIPEIQEKIAAEYGFEFMRAGDHAKAEPVDAEHFSPESHAKLADAVYNKLKDMGI